MTGRAHREVADPLGSSVGDRLWRRLAGIGAVVVPTSAVFTLWTTEVLPWVLFGTLVVYVLGVPTSWLVTRRGGAPVRRHVLLAVVLGILITAVLAIPTDEPLAWWGLFALYTVGIGAPVAALAAWAAQALPSRWVHPVAIVGLIVAGLVLPFGAWLQLRPPAPHDFVVVHEPDLVGQHGGDAHDLAVTLADRFEQRAAAGHPRTAHETWVSVGAELSEQELDGVASWMRHTPDDDLPTLAGSEEPVRLVTTIFEGDDARGCVVVTAHTSRAEPQACADLNLTN